MTTEKKNAISDLTKAQCAAIIEYAYKKTPTLKRISPRAFRSIVGEVGHRDRPQSDSNGKPAGFWCASSLDQLASATGYSVGAVRDVLWLATEVGIVRTVKRGGQNTATKRTIDLDAMLLLLNELCAEYPHLNDEDWRGIWRNKRGLTEYHSGIDSYQRGADTAPSIVDQDSIQESDQHSQRKTKPRNASAFGNAQKQCPKCKGTGKHWQHLAGWSDDPCTECAGVGSL
jgi:hypothetical protein